MLSRTPLLLTESEQRVPDAQWHHPDLDEEHEEIAERARDLGVSSNRLKSALAAGRKGPLHDKHWEQLQNTDSWETTKMEHVRKLASDYERDVDRIHKGMTQGQSLPSPMVVHRPKKPPYLVGGNTRLMVARALGVRPHVIHARLS